MNKLSALLVGFMGAALAACGGSVAPAANHSAPSAAGSPAASAQPASAAGELKPEKVHLTVGRSAPAGSFMPVLAASEAGYFKNHGLDVELQMMAPPVANQGLVSGTLDIYEGATSVVTAILGGADLVYVAAPVDLNTQQLVGTPGLTTLDSLRGKTVATLSAGAFGEIALRWSAKKAGLQVGKDITPLFHPTAEAALATFMAGKADSILTPPPFILQAQQGGKNPVIVDYYKEGLRVVGPGTAVTHDFLRKNPNALKLFLMGYLDGLKRVIDDPAYAKQLDIKYAKLDPDLAEADYREALRQWNKNMVVVPEAIQVTLDASEDPKARTAKAADFFDNSLIEAVNRDYGAKLFPNDVK